MLFRSTTAMLVEPRRLGTAFGVINVLQNTGLFVCNYAAGWLNDANGASAAHPAGYNGMLILFGTLSLVALACPLALWRREGGPHGHGVDRQTLAR